MKTAIFLDNCREKTYKQEDDKFYYIGINELKENLKGSRLFYIGSDSSFHYFNALYDKTYKTGASFKVDLNEFFPAKKINFLKTNQSSDGYLIPLSDL